MISRHGRVSNTGGTTWRRRPRKPYGVGNDSTGSVRSRYVDSGRITSAIQALSEGTMSMAATNSIFRNIASVFARSGRLCRGFCL